jgi:T5SS/PEP-CTERM-associated repeat protein
MGTVLIDKGEKVMATNRRSTAVLLVSLLGLVLVAGSAFAQSTWTGPVGSEGNWTNETYWSGNPPPTDYCNINNGGIAVIDTAVVTNDNIIVGQYAGQTGTLRVKPGGELTAAALRPGFGGFGALEINGGILNSPNGYVMAGVNAGSTGTVTIASGSAVTLKNLRVGNSGTGTCTVNGGTVTLDSYDSEIGTAAGSVGTFIQNGGHVTRNAVTEIGNAAGSTGTYIVSNSTLICNERVYLGAYGTGRFEIHDGAAITQKIDVANQPFSLGSHSGGTGTVEMTGGNLDVGILSVGAADPSLGTFYMRGGNLTVHQYGFFLGAAQNAVGRFYQSGGDVNAQTVYLGRSGSNRTGRYEISGGSLTANIITIENANTNTGAFRLTGSAPEVNIQYLRNDSRNPFLLEFVLDKSPSHLTNLTFTGSGYRTGHLRVGLDGGVLLTATNNFTLLHAAYLNSTDDYNSEPDPNMWTEALVENVDGGTDDESQITLANGYKMGDLDMNGTLLASFAGTPRAMGHVTLANLDTSRMPEGLAIFMDVDTASYGNTDANLAAEMVAAGYEGSEDINEPPYDVRVVIPKAYATDGSAYFAWDFTDVTTGATNATVSAVSFSTWPILGTVVSIR